MLFEDDEAMAIAVVLGLSAGAAVPGIERSALTALAKLDRLLPPRLRARLAALRHATVSLIPPSEVVSTEALILLAEACDNHQRALFSYRAHDGRGSERRVEPHRLVATARRWYLVAFDLDRFELGYALGTEHPSVGWSDHMLEQMKNPALPVEFSRATSAWSQSTLEYSASGIGAPARSSTLAASGPSTAMVAAAPVASSSVTSSAMMKRSRCWYSGSRVSGSTSSKK